MATYTFSTNAGFATPDNLTIINNDCASQITTELTDISAASDSIMVTFSAPLSDDDLTSLRNIFTTRDNYIPPTIIQPYLDYGAKVVKHDVNGIPTLYIGEQSNEIHISKEQQGNFYTLTEALAAHPGENNVFIIHPGDYVEQNPLTLPTGTVLYANGNAENTFITAANPNADIIHLGIKNKIEGITFKGASGTGCRGIYFDASQSGGQGHFSGVFEVFIKGCDIGIEAQANNIQNYGGIPDTLYLREITISPLENALSTGIYYHSGGQVIGVSISVFGFPPTPLPSPAIPITYSFYGENAGSKLAMSLSDTYFCANGLYIDDNCEVELALFTCKYCYNGVVLGPTGDHTRLSVSSLETGSMSNMDLSVYAQDARIEVHSGVLDDSKIYNPYNVRLNMFYHTNTNGQTRQRMLGVINIGTSDYPSTMIVGEGSYDNINTVFVNTNGETGTWTDLTGEANEENSTTPFALFSGVGVGNCLYLGRSKNVLGIKTNVSTATTSVTPLSSLVWEYWNGMSWISFPVMQTRDVAPYYYMQNCYLSEVNTYHVRFGVKSNDSMVAKTLNGVSKKWVRARVVTELSSVPQSEYIKFHTNSFKINGDGFVEYFGDSRTIKKLSWDVTRLGNTTTSMADQNIYFSQNLSIPLVHNKFVASTLSRICLATFIPTDIDNSFPLKIKFAIIGSSGTSGNVKFTVRYDFSNATSDVYLSSGDAPESTSGEKNTNVITAITATNKEFRNEVAIDLSGIDANLYSGGPQMLWLSVERDAGSGDDTYTGDISLIQIVPYYISWIDGGHLLAY